MLTETEAREVLRGHPLFVAFDAARFERLAAVAQLLALEQGRMLFQRGEPARAFFIVLSGQVKLFMQSRAGNEKILALEAPGHSFAEALMFMDTPVYPVAAAATEATVVVAVPCHDYMDALRADTATCLRLLGVLTQRLHAHVQEIEELTLESAGNRFARQLLRRAATDSGGRMRVHFDETRQMLASQLAVKPETLSRLIRSLTDAGVIELDGRDIVIPDISRFQSHLLR